MGKMMLIDFTLSCDEIPSTSGAFAIAIEPSIHNFPNSNTVTCGFVYPPIKMGFVFVLNI
jgi:hypothetical protein